MKTLTDYLREQKPYPHLEEWLFDMAIDGESFDVFKNDESLIIASKSDPSKCYFISKAALQLESMVPNHKSDN